MARSFVPEEFIAAEPQHSFKKASAVSSPFRFNQGAALRTQIRGANDSYFSQQDSPHYLSFFKKFNMSFAIRDLLPGVRSYISNIDCELFSSPEIRKFWFLIVWQSLLIGAFLALIFYFKLSS